MAFESGRTADRHGLTTPISSNIRVREEDSLARTLQLTGLASPAPADLGPLPAFTPCFKQNAGARPGPRLVVLRKT